jgi:predicted N-acyltransferase
MQIEFITSIHALAADEWNSLCPADYPFIRHEFFSALEDSGSTTAATGWQAQHILVREGKTLFAAMPLFIKQHSYGEYVFDWAWADAWRRYGREYYPKLVSAIPFTPCYGPRLLARDGEAATHYLPHIITELQTRARILNASSWHCLFPAADLSTRLTGFDIQPRMGCQFHWLNRNYKNFADFLAQLASRKRKNIAKERRQVEEQGFTFHTKQGPAITADDWDFFAELYRLTYLKRSGHSGYLQREFFHLLGERLPAHTLMIMAEREGVAVAAALYLYDSTTLYGRYWGCREEFDFLHFETCYYQGIEFAIAHKLQRFDGGAQGEHKIQRGFEPVATWSNHWIAASEFRQAINHFLQDERASVEHYMEDARQYLPFKHNEPAE